MISFIDIQLSLALLIVIYIWALQVKKNKKHRNPLYKYFVPGLMVRIFGGIMVCIIYLFYYKGGDTVNYFKGAVCMVNLMFKNFPVFIDIMGGNLSLENYLAFDSSTGYPPTYMYRDDKTFAVIRFITPLVLLTFKNFLATTIVLATLAFSGPWRLFLMFCREFPGLSRQLAIAILFVPSVFFWGSGILKDTFTFSAVCWYTFSFYKAFIIKENRFINMFYMILSLFILIAVKPYLFIAVFPGSLLWVMFHMLNKVEGNMVKVLYAPFAIFIVTIIGMGILSLVNSQLGKYQLNLLLDQAMVIQEDLTRDVYGPNSFDIGEFDGSATSMLSKAPIAVSATLFRPFIWEVRNPAMFLSGMENLIVLVMFILMIFRIKPLVIVKIIFDQPVILFSLIFSIVLAYSVGMSTANFGALVRYKIPLIPFFVSAILIIQYFYKYGDEWEMRKEMEIDQ